MGWTRWLFCAIVLASIPGRAQNESAAGKVDVHMRLALSHPQAKRPAPPAVLWLKPLPGTVAPQFPPHARYSLTQKDRMFKPHLLVIPVGSVVAFPNEDPFFHNVFSLFNGKRFDLGLYEAGSTKDVTFSREGVSYIFCNIHPEMSAVVMSLSTPLYAIADTTGEFQMREVPAGNYEMHVWVEGTPQPDLDRFIREVHLASGEGNLGTLDLTKIPQRAETHLNKFGRPYDEASKPAY
jgi:hypothetical protein